MLEYKTINLVDIEDWDGLVSETYNRPYSFQQQDGCKERGIVHLTIPGVACDYDNDSIEEVVNGNEMGVSFKAWLSRDPNQKLQSGDEWDREHGLFIFWRRNFYPDIQTIANDLHERGLIPTGEYIINIDW